MSVIKKIIEFLRGIFIHKEQVKMLEASVEPISTREKSNFANSLKVTIEKKKKRQELETPICVGDGLGIKKKMSY